MFRIRLSTRIVANAQEVININFLFTLRVIGDNSSVDLSIEDDDMDKNGNATHDDHTKRMQTLRKVVVDVILLTRLPTTYIVLKLSVLPPQSEVQADTLSTFRYQVTVDDRISTFPN